MFVPALISFGGARRRLVGALPRMPEARLQAPVARLLDMCFAVISPHTCAPHIDCTGGRVCSGDAKNRGWRVVEEYHPGNRRRSGRGGGGASVEGAPGRTLAAAAAGSVHLSTVARINRAAPSDAISFYFISFCERWDCFFRNSSPQVCCGVFTLAAFVRFCGSSLAITTHADATDSLFHRGGVLVVVPFHRRATI